MTTTIMPTKIISVREKIVHHHESDMHSPSFNSFLWTNGQGAVAAQDSSATYTLGQLAEDNECPGSAPTAYSPEGIHNHYVSIGQSQCMENSSALFGKGEPKVGLSKSSCV